MAKLAIDPSEWLRLAAGWDRHAQQAEMLANWDKPKGERERWIVATH
jgi:hypothetical protein